MYIYICVYKCIYISIYTHIYICIFVYMHICIHVCIYVYIYISIYVYILRLSYLFAHLDLLYSETFSFLIFFSSLTLPISAFHLSILSEV